MQNKFSENLRDSKNFSNITDLDSPGQTQLCSESTRIRTQLEFVKLEVATVMSLFYSKPVLVDLSGPNQKPNGHQKEQGNTK